MHTLSSALLISLLLIVLTTISATAVDDDHAHTSSPSSLEIQALLTFKHAITDDPFSCLSSWSLDATTTTPTTNFSAIATYNSDSCRLSHVSQHRGPSSDAAHIPGSHNSSSASPPVDHCSWYGVLCDNRFQVISLNLANCCLSGSIDPSLGLLSSLSVLDLTGNTFSGALSPSLFPCPNSSLTHLDLSDNDDLSGEIPPSLPLHSPNLRFLDLSRTNLSGAVPPALWTNLPALQTLVIGSNNLLPSLSIPLGSVPRSGNKFSFCDTIEVLQLSDLNASGTSFPSSLGDCQRLKKLELSVFGLHGSIPSSIWQLPHLETLHIFDPDQYLDNLTDSVVTYKLSWAMPSAFGFCSPTASNITLISIGGIGLTGNIPASVDACSASLQGLDIEVTSLEGPLPSTLVNLTQLSLIFFMSNELLTGAIPDALGTLKKLEYLRLSGSSLTGGIPASLGALTNLYSLDLSQNNLTGGIPPSLGALTELRYLHLSQNNLTGEIPPSLGALTKLQELDLSQNNLTGCIPDTLGALMHTLGYLDLSQNNLTGRIPPDLGELTNLWELDLSQNNLTGILPIDLLHNLTKLHSLSLSRNHFSGRIESLDLSKLPNLLIFDAYGNNFEGALPAGLTEHQGLIFINLQENKLLTGSLGNTTTANITGLYFLRVLSLRYNQLSGDIPAWVWHLPSLQLLDLSNNHFTGYLPATLTHLSYFCMTNQTNDIYSFFNMNLPVVNKNQMSILNYVQNTRIFFDVSMNMLGGEIPKSFGELRGLRGVNLSHNHFNGTIPEGSFGRLNNLDVLDLSYNQLTGEIPQDLATFDISTLNLSSNQLHGPIPTQNSFNTRNDKYVFANNSGLCGIPLPDPCNTGNITSSRSVAIGRKKQGFGVWIWFHEFVSPWSLLITYLISLALGMFFCHSLFQI